MSKVKWCLGFMAGLMLCASCSSSKTEVTPKAPVQEVTVASPYAEALDLFYAHRYKESAESATRVLDAQGSSLEGLTIRGLAYAKANLPKYAIVDLLKAVKMEYSVETLVNLGNALRSFGFCARAVDAYQHALSLDPGNPYILINMTSSYLCLEEVDMADATFVKAIPNLPQDAVAFTNAAILKDMQQDIPEALKARSDLSFLSFCFSTTPSTAPPTKSSPAPSTHPVTARPAPKPINSTPSSKDKSDAPSASRGVLHNKSPHRPAFKYPSIVTKAPFSRGFCCAVARAIGPRPIRHARAAMGSGRAPLRAYAAPSFWRLTKTQATQ